MTSVHLERKYIMTENKNDRYDSYTGIDYSLGQRLESGHLPNCDELVLSAGKSVNIRYSKISIHRVMQMWSDESKPEYPCEDCEFWDEEAEECSDDSVECEPVYYYVRTKEYTAHQFRDSMDVMITKSIYFTYAQFCSPCTPGGCHLEHPIHPENTNNRTYCFGPDWFDEELDPCPYEVWEVKTGKKIYAPKSKEGRDDR